ncbi:MAG: hypothetical protein AUJ12_04115 [Alphaproteobacteria bacterium CG1_02_46_17]|nr:MAG: hypothetical protein AUJ12_04115 [Alphaproteobacteria bacterium CG1_02_46_17]
MAGFNLPNNQSLRIAFVGSDIALRATATYEDELRTCGGALLGSGKMRQHANEQQIKLLHIFAALARGEDVAAPPKIITNQSITVPLDRPDDEVTISADSDGHICFDMKGKDLGMTERVLLQIPNPAKNNARFRMITIVQRQIPVPTTDKVTYQPLYNGLHNYLAEYGSPKIS